MKPILRMKGGKARKVTPVKGEPASKTKPAALVGTGSMGRGMGKGKGRRGGKGKNAQVQAMLKKMNFNA